MRPTDTTKRRKGRDCSRKSKEEATKRRLHKWMRRKNAPYRCQRRGQQGNRNNPTQHHDRRGHHFTNVELPVKRTLGVRMTGKRTILHDMRGRLPGFSHLSSAFPAIPRQRNSYRGNLPLPLRLGSRQKLPQRLISSLACYLHAHVFQLFPVQTSIPDNFCHRFILEKAGHDLAAWIASLSSFMTTLNFENLLFTYNINETTLHRVPASIQFQNYSLYKISINFRFVISFFSRIFHNWGSTCANITPSILAHLKSVDIGGWDDVPDISCPYKDICRFRIIFQNMSGSALRSFRRSAIVEGIHTKTAFSGGNNFFHHLHTP